MIAAVDTKALWYLTRGTGVVSLVLLTVSVALGVVSTSGWAPPRSPRFAVVQVHRNVSLLVALFLLAHIASTVVDGFAPIGWLDAVVPFRSPYRSLWLGLGAVAVDLLAAVIVTSVLRGHLSRRLWQTVHWASYGSWPIALAHGLGTGSDASARWLLGVQAGCAGVVAAAVAWRLWSHRPARPLRPAHAASRTGARPTAPTGRRVPATPVPTTPVPARGRPVPATPVPATPVPATGRPVSAAGRPVPAAGRPVPAAPAAPLPPLGGRQ